MTPEKSKFYTFIWKWHFYAGLIVTPIMLIMALTGATYLFQTEIEDFLYGDRLYLQQPYQGVVNHDAIIDTAKHNFSAKMVHGYIPPFHDNQSAQVILTNDQGQKLTAFIHPTNLSVMGTVDETWRLMNVARAIHGGLMLGTPGKIIVELAACWLIVLIITGLYLWYPKKGRTGRGVAVPNLSANGRSLWREFHAVIGAWASLWILSILLTGLPWSFVWGGLLDNAAQKAGQGFPTAIFKNRPVSTSFRTASLSERDAESSEKEHRHRPSCVSNYRAIHKQTKDKDGLPYNFVSQNSGNDAYSPEDGECYDIPMNKIIEIAQQNNLHHGYKVDYPWHEKGSFAIMPAGHSHDHNVQYVFLDRFSGKILQHYKWDDLGTIGQATSLGVRFHQGQIWGLPHKLINLTAVIILMGLGITGWIMWLKRKPKQGLGVPFVPADFKLSLTGKFILLGLCVFLPLFAVSVLIIFLTEYIINFLKR